MNDKKTKCEIPTKGRKFWHRMIASVLMFSFLSIVIGGTLSSYGPTDLARTGRRTAQIRWALKIMGPAAWGWFIFIGGFLINLAGDWYCYRFQNFPVED